MHKTVGHVLHMDIELKTRDFFLEDSVHLSDVGLEVYNDTLREL